MFFETAWRPIAIRWHCVRNIRIQAETKEEYQAFDSYLFSEAASRAVPSCSHSPIPSRLPDVKEHPEITSCLGSGGLGVPWRDPSRRRGRFSPEPTSGDTIWRRSPPRACFFRANSETLDLSCMRSLPGKGTLTSLFRSETGGFWLLGASPSPRDQAPASRPVLQRMRSVAQSWLVDLQKPPLVGTGPSASSCAVVAATHVGRCVLTVMAGPAGIASAVGAWVSCCCGASSSAPPSEPFLAAHLGCPGPAIPCVPATWWAMVW